MSVRIMSMVFDRSTASGNDRLVLLAIADEANDDGAGAYPSVDRITAKARLNKRTTMRCIERLETLGELIVERPEVRGRGRHNRYRIPPLPLPNGDTLSPFPDPGKGAQRRAPGMHQTHRPVVGSGSSVENAALALDAPTLDLVGFEYFFDAYPKRNGKRIGRRTCEALWSKLPLDDRRAAFRGAMHYAAAVEAGITIAKDPERFLRHRVWEDWQEPAEPDPRPGRRVSTVEESWRNIVDGPTEGIR